MDTNFLTFCIGLGLSRYLLTFYIELDTDHFLLYVCLVPLVSTLA